MDEQDRLPGVVTDTTTIAWLLPRYVTEDQALVAVRDGGRLLGGITSSRLLTRLLARP